MSALLLPAAIALPLLVVAANAFLTWRQVVRATEFELARTADASAEYMRRVLDGHRLRADRANDLLRGLSDGEVRAREAALHQALRDIVARDHGTGGITLTVFDRDGHPLVSANIFPLPRDLSFADREYIRALRTADAAEAFVSPVYVGRLDGNVFFTVSQRRTGGRNGLPDGAFDGVVNLSVSVDDAGAALRRLRSAKDDVIALVRSDGEVLARSTGLGKPPPVRLQAGSPMLPVMARGEERALVSGRSTLDGRTRLAALRRVDGYPVYASAARPREAVVARWWEAVAPQLAVGIPATLALALLALIIRRRESDVAAANRALERRVEERTAALHASERRLTAILDQLPAGVIVAEAPSGRILFGNATVARLFGPGWARSASAAAYPADWLPRRTDTGEPYAVEDIPMVRALGGEVVEAETMRFPPRDGRGGTELLVNAAPLRDGADAIVGGVVAFADVTALRAAEAVARDREAKLTLALAAADLATWEIDLRDATEAGQGGAAEAVAEGTSLAGISAALLSPATLADAMVHPEDAARLRAARDDLAAGRVDQVRLEYRVRRPGQAGWTWLESFGGIVQRDASTGTPLRLAGVARDVSDRKAAEAALAESEARLRAMVEVAPQVVWTADPEGRLSFASAVWWDTTGQDPAAVLGGHAWLEALHPEDAGPMFGAWEAAQAEARRGGPGRFEAEFRLRRAADGAYRWFFSRGVPERDAEGRVLRWIGAAFDIHERKTAEQALAASETRLRESTARLSTLVDALPLGVGLSDAEGRLLVANEAMRRFVPAVVPSRDPVRRHRWRGFHPDGRRIDPADFPVARALRGEAVLPGLELIHADADGRETWTRVSAVPLRDEAGGVVGSVLIVADITAQKALEERQALLMRELDHRARNALAVVQAALRLTPRDDPQVYASAVEGRVTALARAHGLLAAGRWDGAALRRLVEGELATFLPTAGAAAGAAPQVEVQGPELTLAPAAAQALSMALHELATNATKHGALGVPHGRVVVSWQVDRAAGRLLLRWAEQGGPPVPNPPTRRGFGSRVIEATVRDQLGGAVGRSWTPEGLVCTIEIPLARAEAQPGGGDVAERAAAAPL